MPKSRCLHEGTITSTLPCNRPLISTPGLQSFEVKQRRHGTGLRHRSYSQIELQPRAHTYAQRCIRSALRPGLPLLGALPAPDLCCYVIVPVPIQHILNTPLQMLLALCCSVEIHMSCNIEDTPITLLASIHTLQSTHCDSLKLSCSRLLLHRLCMACPTSHMKGFLRLRLACFTRTELV